MLIVGVGNDWRGDDAAGLEVARRLGGVEHQGGEMLALLDLWRGRERVAIVDAAAPGPDRAGAVHRFDAAAGPLPARALGSRGHAFGLAEVVELGRALGRLPPSLAVYAIEGERFGLGDPLTPAVERAVEAVVAELAEALAPPATGPRTRAPRPTFV